MTATLHMDAEQVQALLQSLDALLSEWKEEVGHLRLLKQALFQVWDAPATADFVAQYWWTLEKIEDEVDGLRDDHRRAWKEFHQWRDADARLEGVALLSSKPIRQPPARPEPDWSKMGPVDKALYEILNKLFEQANVGPSDEQTIWISVEALRKLGIDFFNLGQLAVGGQIAITRSLDGMFHFQYEVSAETAAGLGIDLPIAETGTYLKGKTVIMLEKELAPHELDPASALSKSWHAVEVEWHAGVEVEGGIHFDFSKLGLDKEVSLESLDGIKWQVEQTPQGLQSRISLVRSLKGEIDQNFPVDALRDVLNLESVAKSDFETKVAIEIIQQPDGSQEIELHLYGGKGEYLEQSVAAGGASSSIQGGVQEVAELTWKIKGLSVGEINEYLDKGQIEPLLKAATGDFTREEILRAVGESKLGIADRGLKVNMVSEGVDIDYLDRNWVLNKIYTKL